MGRYFPLMEMLACFCIVLLIAVGGTKVINRSMSLGELVSFFSMIWYIIGPMWGIGFHINNYTQSKASGERVLELLDTPVDVENRKDAIVLNDSQVTGHVQFNDVTFRYEGDVDAIRNVTIDAEPGKVIGLLGGTGSGKTTIIQLLMRAYDVKQEALCWMDRISAIWIFKACGAKWRPYSRRRSCSLLPSIIISPTGAMT